VGLCGLLGSGNLGNDGMLESVLAYLRADQPDAIVDFMCSGPERVQARYGFAAIPLNWYQKHEQQASGVPGIALRVLGKGIDKVLFALILVQWAYFARAARGAALVERNKEYVEAATCLALPASRIVFRHMLPNCMPSLIVIATITLARAIALEATLSFLGVGVPVTQPSLGMLISNGFEFLLSGSYWISFFPGVALAIAIVGINLAGDQLRDVLNPRNLR
jgi:ABC-type microcin C transport system permease subunit YejE